MKVYKESDCASLPGGGGREGGGRGAFPASSHLIFFPAGIDCITYFTLFNINFAS